ncbi:MAG: hypothetical protein R3301_19660, partial [Saprospiraceae bacterium]|nr:hypothetical protein [Saprospiraceae bacterium]
MYPFKRLTVCLVVLAWILPMTGQAQQYFPPPGVDWETRTPQDVGFNPVALDSAVQFALDNEYSGSRDLRIAILEGFQREPFHEILGPTKKRGGPAGV